MATAPSQDHYAVLNLGRGATKQQIKAKFYELSKKTHPDAPGGDVDKFHKIGEAYEILSDDSKRRAYDQAFTPNPPSYTNPSQSDPFHYTPFTSTSYYSNRRTGPHSSWNPGRRNQDPSSSTDSAYERFGPRGSPRYGPRGPDPSADPFASPSPEPGQPGGPLFGSGYTPFGRHDPTGSKGPESTDYGDPFTIPRGFGYGSGGVGVGMGGFGGEGDIPLHNAEIRDPWSVKQGDRNARMFQEAKGGKYSETDSAVGEGGGMGVVGLVFLGLFGIIWFGVGVAKADEGEDPDETPPVRGEHLGHGNARPVL